MHIAFDQITHDPINKQIEVVTRGVKLWERVNFSQTSTLQVKLVQPHRQEQHINTEPMAPLAVSHTLKNTQID